MHMRPNQSQGGDQDAVILAAVGCFTLRTVGVDLIRVDPLDVSVENGSDQVRILWQRIYWHEMKLGCRKE